jgi:hypothetical protein
MSWTGFLDAAAAADHAVQIYDDLDELSDSVARFLDAGFRAGEPAVVIATGEHWQAFAATLGSRGWDPHELRARGLLTCYDAERMLEALMDAEAPASDRFERVVGGAVDEIAARFPDKTIRAFGDMVDVLWRSGRERAAVALEELWNGLARTRRFALLCGYRLDVFDIDVQISALPRIIHTHTHPRPVADTSRLAAAVDKALAEVVGPIGAGQIYIRVAEEVPRTELTRAQAVLMWLSSKDPPVAQQVLARARTHYLALGTAAATNTAAAPATQAW